MPLIPRPPFWKQKVTTATTPTRTRENPLVEELQRVLTRDRTETQRPDTVKESLVDWATDGDRPSPKKTYARPFFVYRQIQHCENQKWIDLIPTYYCINKALTEIYTEEQLRSRGQGVVSMQNRLHKLIKEHFNVYIIPNLTKSAENNWNNENVSLVPTVDYQQIVDFVKLQEQDL